MMQISKTPIHHFFHDLRFGLFNIPTGTSSSSIVLTPIVGKIAILFFVARATTNLKYDNFFAFKEVDSWAILNSSSTNIVGGQSISSQLALHYLNLYWCRSSFPSETQYSSTNNNAYVYAWSFSNDPLDALCSR